MDKIEKILSATCGSNELDRLIWSIVPSAPQLPYSQVNDAAMDLATTIVSGLDLKVSVNEPGGLWFLIWNDGGCSLVEEEEITVTGPASDDPQRIQYSEGAALRTVKDAFRIWKSFQHQFLKEA